MKLNLSFIKDKMDLPNNDRYNKLREYAIAFNQEEPNPKYIIPLDKIQDGEELLCYLWNREVLIPSLPGLTFGYPYDEIFSLYAVTYSDDDLVDPNINHGYLYPLLKHWQQLP
jgi:hypothetical protein